MRLLIASLAVAAITIQVDAQAPTIDHLTPSELLQTAQALEPKAQAADGAASAKLSDYPNHYTMISLRHQNGGAEVHQQYSDLFFILEGKATLLSGGELENEKAASPGEMRGTAVKKGTPTELNKGDFVHIPAGVPHQLLIAKDSTFVYFVVKVKEK